MEVERLWKLEGSPEGFVTLTAAEYHWTLLLCTEMVVPDIEGSPEKSCVLS